jgi:hypothetical protein
MKTLGLIAAFGAALTLAACGSSNEAKLKADCGIVVGDKEIAKELIDAGVTADAFCGCVATTFAAMPEAELAGAQSSMTMLATSMKDGGAGGEALYKELKKKARADDATAADKATSEAFDEFGEQLEAVFEGMEVAGGACPA